jgi:hypothetical protein
VIRALLATTLALTAGALAVTPAAAVAATALPPANATFDYQIGAPYTPPSGVTVVSRDRTVAPAAGIYNICYVNAFQTQSAEVDWWQANHDDLLLKDGSGNYVVDSAWDEILLDTSTAAKRSALATIENGWLDGCASAGFKAVEPDNLDSYERSGGRLTQSGNVAFVQLLATHAHAKSLAIAQKNTAELGTAGKTAGLDFAVAEACGRYDECGDYTDVYDNHVIVIEYTSSAFTKACKTWGSTLSIVQRDLNVTAPGSGSYKYAAC